MANRWVTLTFNTVEYNVGGVWNASHNDRLTAPVDGTYLIIVSVRWAANATEMRELAIDVGGTDLVIVGTAAFSDGGLGLAQSVERAVKLKAGAVVQTGTCRDSTGNLNIVSSLGSPYMKTPMFEMQWIHPIE